MTFDIWWINTIAGLLMSGVSAGFLIPKILLFAFRKRIFDTVGSNKIHTSVVPRLGGLAFTPVILFTLFLVMGVNYILGLADYSEEWNRLFPQLALGICAVLTIYVVGIADDLIGVRYRAKFVVQTFCAILLVMSGLWIDNLHGILGIYELPRVVGWLFSVFVIVFILNAINLIDGIDGLASGLSSIAFLYYGFILMYHESYICGIVAFAALGTLIPFFYYNVFGKAEHGRKIFMGDTGSLTTGLTLSVVALAVTHLDLKIHEDANLMVVTFAPLIIPCFDVIRVVIHRLREKKNPFLPDKNHIHHKLLRLGMSQQTALSTIVVSSLIFSCVNMLVAGVMNVNIILFCDIAIYTVLNIWLTHAINEKEKNMGLQK